MPDVLRWTDVGLVSGCAQPGRAVVVVRQEADEGWNRCVLSFSFPTRTPNTHAATPNARQTNPRAMCNMIDFVVFDFGLHAFSCLEIDAEEQRRLANAARIAHTGADADWDRCRCVWSSDTQRSVGGMQHGHDRHAAHRPDRRRHPR